MLINDSTGQPAPITIHDVIRAGKFTGFADAIPNELYHKAPGLSNSGMKHLAVTPAKFQAYVKGLLAKDETASQRLGTLCHMRVLEPELFEKKIKHYPNFKSKANQEDSAAFEATGGYACTTKEYDQSARMAEAVLKHPRVGHLFKGGVSERACFWRDPDTGILLKCKLDKFHPEAGVVLDLKYFNNLNDYELTGQIRRMKYDWQNAHYSEGAEATHDSKVRVFANVFVEESEPYGVRVVILGNESLSRAQAEIKHFRAIFAECERTGNWPGYPETFDEIELPAW